MANNDNFDTFDRTRRHPYPLIVNDILLFSCFQAKPELWGQMGDVSYGGLKASVMKKRGRKIRYEVCEKKKKNLTKFQNNSAVDFAITHLRLGPGTVFTYLLLLLRRLEKVNFSLHLFC